MRPELRLASVILPIAIVPTAVTGCALPPAFAPTTPTAQACPGALLEGTLTRGPDGMAVVAWEFGEQAVQWPDGYRVEMGPALRLLDDHGNLVASEGEPIYIGGGFTARDELFIACGHVSSEPP